MRVGFLLFCLWMSLVLVQAQNFTQTAKVVAPDRSIDDGFSSSVAIDGDYAIAGAAAENHNVNGNNPLDRAGSAYIFERDSESGEWTFAQKLVAGYRQPEGQFGFSVAISGSYAIVGAMGTTQYRGRLISSSATVVELGCKCKNLPSPMRLTKTTLAIQLPSRAIMPW